MGRAMKIAKQAQLYNDVLLEKYQSEITSKTQQNKKVASVRNVKKLRNVKKHVQTRVKEETENLVKYQY